MTNLNLHIPESLEEFVAMQSAVEGHGSASEYLLSLLSKAKRERERSNLERGLFEGVEALDRGEGRPVTPETWQQMRVRLEAKHGPKDGA